MSAASCRTENMTVRVPGLAARPVALNVARLERTTAFYRHVFGFRVVADARHERERCVIMTAPGEVRIALREEKGLNDVSAADVARRRPHTLRLPVGNLDEMRASLWDLGVPLARGTREPGETGSAQRCLFVDDPDGNRIELVETRGSWEPGWPVEPGTP